MLSERLQKLRNFTQARKYKKYRTNFNENYLRKFKKLKYNFSQRSAHILKAMCEAEDPIVFKDEKITFIRTKNNVPYYYDNKFIKRTFGKRKGICWDVFHNLTPDYSILLNCGLENRKNLAIKVLQGTKNKNKRKYLESVIVAIDAVLELAERYSIAAEAVGNFEIAKIMKNIPRNAASGFQEALQSLRFISSMFYLADNYQFGFGRMDQYLYPFYEKDIKENKISKEEAKELLEEFFISLNKDTDLYRGVQQGDNGQSVMLAGCKSDGTSAINELTYLILDVSKELKLIDPKINLRVDSNTPDDLLKLGCELTQCGLGFPQYSNDEAVIPALVKMGYDIEDAREYTVAACWEFIIPGKGLEIVNEGAVSFPYTVDIALEKTLNSPFKFSMEKFRKNIKNNIKDQIKNIITKRNIRTLPSPFASIFFHNCIEQGLDASDNAKYQNIGIHGAGSSNGADAIASIKKTFVEKGVEGLKELVEAKNKNFEGYELLRENLINNMPKVGNADDYVDEELKYLFDTFADCAETLSTPTKKIRPGSGSAMYYVWLTNENNSKWLIEPTIKATVDGRKQGEFLAASLAPSNNIKVNGVLSVLKSFSNIDYSRIINGGPITIELTPSVFTSDDGITKLANLIKYFVKLGNQQLQLNVLDVATLEDALKHPELHRNLIVRVWGWSGYFCELAPEYQQHVINRHKYQL